MSTARSRRKGTSLILSFILLALLLFIFNSIWSDRDKRSGEVSVEATSITIAQANKPEIHMERRGTQWRMLQPEQLLVLTERIEPLLKLKYIPGNAYHAEDVDLAAAHLDTPLATISIGNSIILIGAEDISGERRYAMQMKRVYFVPEWTLSLIESGAQAFTDPLAQP